MQKGFTLIELLGVIIVLAAILAIVAPIVTDLIRDSKNKTIEASLEMYGKAVTQAAMAYELEKDTEPTSFEDIESYIKYDGKKVTCEKSMVAGGGDVYLADCSVDGKKVDGFTYGNHMIKGTLAYDILENYGGVASITVINDFSNPTQDGEYGLYTAEDDLGASYYFRGDVPNNYVKFGSYAPGTIIIENRYYEYENGWLEFNGKTDKTLTVETPMYWRIVRINGDGTIRLIYDGIEKLGNGTMHTTSISNTLFTGNNNDGRTVGYTYDDGTGTQIDSAIKGALDGWYQTHLKTNYGKYIADSIFCNDRRVESGTAGGYATYNSYIRRNETMLVCPQKEDRYTLSTDIGNGYLSNPIGLLTASEIIMAGESYGNSNANKNFYLYSGDMFVTMTPEFAEVGLNSYGIIFMYTLLGDYGLTSDYSQGARPVINLKSDVKFTGSGTIDDPYVIVTE